jgi:uncharacterized protein YwgA
MMASFPEAVADVVALNGGRLVGKTRLQKTMYFLESAGLGPGFDFQYHYYGPYSEDLAIASDEADLLDLLDAKSEVSARGDEYVIYETSDAPVAIGQKYRASASRLLNVLRGYDAVTLELAATAHFLSENGFDHDSWAETRRRKAGKWTPERQQKAERLLSEIEGIGR